MTADVLDWCPGMREACSHWHDAPMLQHTFEALQVNLESENDASIDAAKGFVECVCRVIIKQLDDSTSSLKPRDGAPVTEWVSAATRVLRLGDTRHRGFANLIKHHNGLAESLRVLRNDAGPLSHGKDGFIQVLTAYHRRAAILAADAIVTFLHQAYLETEWNLVRTYEPYERFSHFHGLIDANVPLQVDVEDESLLMVKVILPSGDLTLRVEASRLLYQLDREVYVEVLNAMREALASVAEQDGEKG